MNNLTLVVILLGEILSGVELVHIAKADNINIVQLAYEEGPIIKPTPQFLLIPEIFHLDGAIFPINITFSSVGKTDKKPATECLMSKWAVPYLPRSDSTKTNLAAERTAIKPAKILKQAGFLFV